MYIVCFNYLQQRFRMAERQWAVVRLEIPRVGAIGLAALLLSCSVARASDDALTLRDVSDPPSRRDWFPLPDDPVINYPAPKTDDSMAELVAKLADGSAQLKPEG